MGIKVVESYDGSFDSNPGLCKGLFQTYFSMRPDGFRCFPAGSRENWEIIVGEENDIVSVKGYFYAMPAMFLAWHCSFSSTESSQQVYTSILWYIPLFAWHILAYTGMWHFKMRHSCILLYIIVLYDITGHPSSLSQYVLVIGWYVLVHPCMTFDSDHTTVSPKPSIS